MNDDQRQGKNRIVAVSLLTAEELRNVGTGLRRLYPVPDGSDFSDILQQLGKALLDDKRRS